MILSLLEAPIVKYSEERNVKALYVFGHSFFRFVFAIIVKFELLKEVWVKDLRAWMDYLKDLGFSKRTQI